MQHVVTGHAMIMFGYIFEPMNNKTTKMTYAPSEDSHQPAHPGSLISLRCALSGSLRTQGLFMQTAKTLIRLVGCIRKQEKKG